MTSIKDYFTVRQIEKNQTYEWIKQKHYAKRIPIILHSFGLFDSNLILNGILTYGIPARMLNDGKGIFDGKFNVKTLELNRLVVNDNLPKNTLSYFVSQTFKLIPLPVCLVSYADGSVGHHGYIYQATNWYYTGMTSTETVYYNKLDNRNYHARSIVSIFGTREISRLPDYITIRKETNGKYRYIKFLGSKTDIKKMKSFMVYPLYPYPKGDNFNYDSSYCPNVQKNLF